MSVKQKDFIINDHRFLPSGCAILTLKTVDGSELPACHPGQFVQVQVDTPGVFLRRPISICDIDNDGNLVLFIKPIGKGSRHLTEMKIGEKLNLVLPLGNGFSQGGHNVLLVGGGVGAAPLVYLAKNLCRDGVDVSVAIGGRTSNDVIGLEQIYGNVAQFVVSTDDGSMGEKGIITENSIFKNNFDRIYCCGPTPMMRAVAKIALDRNIWCEVSLENQMACGLGACLCCVQETSDHGNVCVCTEGPVFNIIRLESWI